MVASIRRAGGGPRSLARTLRPLLHILGNIGGGVGIGLLFGWIGIVVQLNDSVSLPLRIVAIGLVTTVYSLGDLRGWHLLRPQMARQTPRSWRYRWPPALTAVLYGVDLGSGVLTRVITGGLYSLVAAAFFLGPSSGALLMGAFGFGRGLIVAIWLWWSWPQDDDRFYDWMTNLLHWTPSFQRSLSWTAVGIGLVLIVGALRDLGV